MGIMGMISQTKAKFRQMQTNKTMAQANELKQLREERIRLEGQAKIDKLYRSEKEKIAKAKYEMRRSKTAKVRSLAKGLQRTIKDRQAQGKGIQFGANSSVYGGGTGPQFGGSSGFSLAPKKEIQKPKAKEVIIKIKQ